METVTGGKLNVVVGFLMLLALQALAQKDSVRAYQSGRSLFATHCSPCHGVHKEKIGPMLASVTKKHTNEWLMAFVRNSQAVIASDDDYAAFLFEQYNHQVMPAFKFLSEEEIRTILQYIEAESIQPTEDFDYSEDVRESGSPTVLRGRTIFDAQCASCHSIGKEDYGPALGSVSKRLPEAWLVSFIRNSQAVIQSGDPYARHLYEAFDEKEMVPMEFLSRTDVRAILEYIRFVSASENHIAGANGRKVTDARQGLSLASVALHNVHDDKSTFTVFIIVLAVMGGCIHGFLIVKLFTYLNKGHQS